MPTRVGIVIDTTRPARRWWLVAGPPTRPELGAGNKERRPSTRVRVRVRNRSRSRMREAESLSFGKGNIASTRPLLGALPEGAPLDNVGTQRASPSRRQCPNIVKDGTPQKARGRHARTKRCRCP
jgi:hypothetical protein